MKLLFVEPKCRNNHRHCVAWARAGWCNRSPWMENNCPKSCDICDDSAEHVGGGGSREVDSVESTEEKGESEPGHLTMTHDQDDPGMSR